jgi:hypothetical protein
VNKPVTHQEDGSTMNQPQRVGIFVGIALLFGTLVLHSPWKGYFEIGDSFFDWVAKEPALFWFGSVSNLLASMGAIAALTVTFVLLFKTPRTG